MLESLCGRQGWLKCDRLTLSALETEDLVMFVGFTEDGTALDEAQCRRFFDLPAKAGDPCDIPPSVQSDLNQAEIKRQKELLEEMTARNGRWFDTEMDKLAGGQRIAGLH